MPTGLITAIAVMVAYGLARAQEVRPDESRTAATVVAMVIGLVVLFLVAQPLVPWKVALIAAMGGLFALAMVIPKTASSSPSSSHGRRWSRHSSSVRRQAPSSSSRGGWPGTVSRPPRRASRRSALADVVGVETGELAAQPPEPLADPPADRGSPPRSRRRTATGPPPSRSAPAPRRPPARPRRPARCGRGARTPSAGSYDARVGRAPCPRAEPLLVDRVSDEAPGLGQVEPLGANDRFVGHPRPITRSTRNVRSPASVAATRYQTVPLLASPSGCTRRSVSARRGPRSPGPPGALR